MGLLRIVDTQHGQITYMLEKKRIKNLNLRLKSGGAVFLSVPVSCTPEQADVFIRAKSGWIAARRNALGAAAGAELLPELDRESCCRLLWESLERVYPYVAPYGVEKPVLKIRKMRSQWGNCHWMQGYITLNTALHRCPERLRDYVALHELVHFIHHDHGHGFYAVMDALMPDWRARRLELKGYVPAIRTE